MTGSIDQSLYHTLTGSYAVPGIARVARKLEIDHAPAITTGKVYMNYI